MAGRHDRKMKSLQMRIGNDPALWHFADLQEALEVNSDLLARLIHASQEVQYKAKETDHKASESDTFTEGNKPLY